MCGEELVEKIMSKADKYDVVGAKRGFQRRITRVGTDIVNSIERRLKQSGKRRVDLARAAGVSKAHITQMLNGRENLTIATLVKLATALKCKLRIEFRPRKSRKPIPAPTRAELEGLVRRWKREGKLACNASCYLRGFALTNCARDLEALLERGRE